MPRATTVVLACLLAANFALYAAADLLVENASDGLLETAGRRLLKRKSKKSTKKPSPSKKKSSTSKNSKSSSPKAPNAPKAPRAPRAPRSPGWPAGPDPPSDNYYYSGGGGGGNGGGGGGGGSSYTGNNLIDTVLSMHNDLRARHGAGPLSWSDGLAASAQAYSNECHWGHSHMRGVGENLAGYSGDDLGMCIDLWVKEGYSGGHFTQMVWQDTTEVGCGYTDCRGSFGMFYLVCQYNPPGNVYG